MSFGEARALGVFFIQQSENVLEETNKCLRNQKECEQFPIYRYNQTECFHYKSYDHCRISAIKSGMLGLTF